MQKVDSNSKAGTAADSDMQPIAHSSASIEANPMLPAVELGKLRPILFSTTMVQAILEGRKTQTRRVVKMRDGSLMEAEDLSTHIDGSFDKVMDFTKTYPYWQELKCPYGNVGDILWVRETFSNDLVSANDGIPLYTYAADMPKGMDLKGLGWKPSIFMPFAACRIFLKIINIKVEPLQEINNADAFAEGIEWKIKFPDEHPDLKYYRDYMFKDRFATGILFEAKHSFKSLWFKINGRESWENNPFVWVIEFERCVHP